MKIDLIWSTSCCSQAYQAPPERMPVTALATSKPMPWIPDEVAANIFGFAVSHSDKDLKVFFATKNEEIHRLNCSLGFFPPRDTESLTTKLNLSLICKSYHQVMQPIMMETVHLRDCQDLVAFHRITKPGALMRGRYVKELAVEFATDDCHEFLSLLGQLSEVFRALPHLLKLDLSQMGMG